MGLPLYVPPVEAERRCKTNSRNLAHGRSTIRRAHRLNSDAVRESRRRRVLATVAYHNLTQGGRPRDQDQEHEQDRQRGRGDGASAGDWPPATAEEQILQQFLDGAREAELVHAGDGRFGSSESRWLAESAARSPPPPPRSTGLAGEETISPGDLWAPQTQVAFGPRSLAPASPSSYLSSLYHSGTVDPSPRSPNPPAYGFEGPAEHILDDVLNHAYGEGNDNAESDGRRLTIGGRFLRRPSSLRRSIESHRRPMVNWSDSNPISRLRRASPSQNSTHVNASSGGGDTNNSDSSQDNASSRRHTWAIRYFPHPLPSIRTILGGQVDGLGDRSRSLSPEGDGVWDTLLTTLTPDPQPPSLNSSFASGPATSSAAAAQDPSTISLASSIWTADDATAPPQPPPAPVSTLMSQSARSFAAGSTSASTATSTSQRVRSPFTVVSASTDTANESTILPETTGQDEEGPGCDESDMESDDQWTMARNHRTLFYRNDAPSWDGRAYVTVTNGRDMGHSSGGDGGDSSGSRGRGRANNHNGGSGNEDPLERLGIGGMQNIVRNLARREDIPDEWWAEAGLSRMLARGSSN